MDCCADCGSVAGEDVSLKACKSCKLAKYCNVNCQKNHWKKHKKVCKRHAAELHDEAMFKDPPAKEDCPICFLPMPVKLIACMTLPPATITSIPINDYAEANVELANKDTETYYSCCGKSFCGGCSHSISKSGNNGTCVFCKGVNNRTEEEKIEELMKRVEVNDAGAMYVLGNNYHHGGLGLQQDREKAIELWIRAAALGSSKAHFHLGVYYHAEGDSKKSKFHYEAAAMAGNENARSNLGTMEAMSRNMGRAEKHWTIAASAGEYNAMHNLLIAFNQGSTSRATIDSSLRAYNKSCIEMRSAARDAAIRLDIVSIGAR